MRWDGCVLELVDDRFRLQSADKLYRQANWAGEEIIHIPPLAF